MPGEKSRGQLRLVGSSQGGQLDVATIARYTDLSETEVQELADGHAKH